MGKTVKGKKHRTIQNKQSRIIKILALGFVSTLFIFIFSSTIKQAQSDDSVYCCPLVGTCNDSQCTQSQDIISDEFHPPGETAIFDHTVSEFRIHRFWMTKIFLKEELVPELQKMAQILVKTIYHHASAIGKLFDAKHQLETQRLMQKLAFEASQNYQPSESFCWFGTGVRSLHSAEAKEIDSIKKNNTLALNYQTGKENTAFAGSLQETYNTRWDNFKSTYCRIDDNNSGLNEACTTTGSRPNNDISYNKLVNSPRTIEANFDKTNLNSTGQDILALRENLYGLQIPTRQLSLLSKQDTRERYMRLRSLLAKRGVAQASFNAILGIKNEGETSPVKDNLKAILTGLGSKNYVAFDIGDKPSYYAQLELLAKRIYQNPHFYAELYESPENIERKSAALKTIELMLERAIAESETRQEMMMSVLLSTKLEKTVEQAGNP